MNESGASGAGSSVHDFLDSQLARLETTVEGLGGTVAPLDNFSVVPGTGAAASSTEAEEIDRRSKALWGDDPYKADTGGSGTVASALPARSACVIYINEAGGLVFF